MTFIAEVARAYELAPTLAPNDIIAWYDLAYETQTLYERIELALNIERTSDAEPYSTAYAMLTDIAQGRLLVSTANSNHPVWSTEDNIRFRVVHDVIGHASTGAGFDFRGEMCAYEKHLSHTKGPKARLALFTEAVGQVAYRLQHGYFTEQKVALLPQHLQWSYDVG